ncbi:unnamed protein product [Amoebophrya sp. A25]|nr:unnamed protein product [Amoebophrya sp. A25]|eukprot:GSA25T00002906001.1
MDDDQSTVNMTTGSLEDLELIEREAAREAEDSEEERRERRRHNLAQNMSAEIVGNYGSVAYHQVGPRRLILDHRNEGGQRTILSVATATRNQMAAQARGNGPGRRRRQHIHQQVMDLDAPEEDETLRPRVHPSGVVSSQQSSTGREPQQTGSGGGRAFSSPHVQTVGGSSTRDEAQPVPSSSTTFTSHVGSGSAQFQHQSLPGPPGPEPHAAPRPVRHQQRRDTTVIQGATNNVNAQVCD